MIARIEPYARFLIDKSVSMSFVSLEDCDLCSLVSYTSASSLSSCITWFDGADGEPVDWVNGCVTWTREGPGVGELRVASGAGAARDKGEGGRDRDGDRDGNGDRDGGRDCGRDDGLGNEVDGG